MGRKILVATRSRHNQKGPHSKSKGDRDLGDGTRNKGGKGKNKGARWAKGHSCVSNPKTTKFREQVQSTFLHSVNPGNSLLTVKNLGARSNLSVAGDEDNDTVLSSDVASLTISDGGLSAFTSASSVRTIASGWSQVSCNAFERFLRKFKGDIVAHKDMLSILGAVSEVIGEAGGKKNETEFFANFMNLLDSCPADQYQPVMSLVCIVIGKVSPGVLKLRSGDIYPKIGKILLHAVENQDDLLIRTSIEAATKLLKIQDHLNFSEDKALESLIYSVLKCVLHERPRVRRKARQSVKALIVAFNDKKSPSAIPKVVIGWIMDQLACYPVCDSKVVADALTLLATCWSAVTKIATPGAKKLFEAVLRVMSSGDAAIMKIGLSFFVVVFQNESIYEDTTQTDISLTNKVLSALWELQPDWRNNDTFVIWLTCVLLGMVRSESAATCGYLSKIFEIVNPVWLTNHAKRVLKVLQEYLPHIIKLETECEVIDACFQTLAKSYLVIPPNPFVLQVTEAILDQLTPEQFTKSAKEVFVQLTPLTKAPGVTSVMGKFVKAFGVEKLWSFSDSTTRWNVILPLLQDNLYNANIKFWNEEIFSHIGKIGSPKAIWEALIGFARDPKDPDNFPAKLVGKVISDKPEVRLEVLASLRQFIEWPQSKEVALKYSVNYLPLLFNLYVQEKGSSSHPGHSDAIAVTVQKYLPFCEQSFTHTLLEKAFTKLDSEGNEVSPLFDLIAFLALHIKDQALEQKLLQLIRARFTDVEERKRVYRVMTYLARNESVSAETLEALYKQLCDSKGETKTNAAAIRVECINVVTDKSPQWMKSLLSEVILNLVSVNAKAKRCAVQFITKYCSFFKEGGDKSFDEIIAFSKPVFESDSPLLVSSTAFFLFLVYKELHPPSPCFDLLSSCFENLRNMEDALVWKYCLSFINLNLSLYKGLLGPVTPLIGAVAGDSRYPRREINKILARMIKTFGAPGLKAVLPNADDPKMRSRIKNLCKKLRKMKEDKIKGDRTEEVSEDEEEEEDEFGNVKAESKPLVIKEGLVDFLNPKEISQALINEAPMESDDVEFKETKDGKLIIGNVKDGDSSESSDDDDSDSDIDMEAARLSRKRKVSSASVASSKKSSRTSYTAASHKSVKTSKSSKGGKRPMKSAKRNKLSSKASVKSRTSAVRFK